MSNVCVKFPSIDQYRNALKNIKHQMSYDGQDEEGEAKFKRIDSFPTVKFYGTVKAHGTNAAIRQDQFDNEILYQSRERVITPLDDNAGFAGYMEANAAKVRSYINGLRIILNEKNDTPLIVYGEWAGGNIQKGVALSGLDKMFLVFAIRIGTELETRWIRPNHPLFDMVHYPDLKFYSINNFGHYEIEVDLNAPEIAQNKLVEITNAVEAECPIGKFFGVSGVGEGVVWFCEDPEYQAGSVFKVKGEKHSVSKVKTTATIDVERVESLRALVDTLVTENRLNQMVGVLKDKEGLDVDPKNTGAFVRLVIADCVKEELDTIVENGFDVKTFGGAASKKISNFFLTYEA